MSTKIGMVLTLKRKSDFAYNAKSFEIAFLFFSFFLCAMFYDEPKRLFACGWSVVAISTCEQYGTTLGTR